MLFRTQKVCKAFDLHWQMHCGFFQWHKPILFDLPIFDGQNDSLARFTTFYVWQGRKCTQVRLSNRGVSISDVTVQIASILPLPVHH